jgi:hypothetical protein
MVFRRVTPDQYARLVDFCIYEEIAFELKTLGKTTLMFGLPNAVWRRIDYGNLVDTMFAGEIE